ncbi:MAG: sigma-54-dependent transcriptional regulator [Muribaculaceae bacterium]
MILIVDDDAGIRSSLKFLLTHSGNYNVLTASNGEEAIEIVRNNSLRLVISDMNFSSDTSGRDGLELLQKVKILSPQTPVFLITAWSSIPLAVTGIKLGATDFIAKPWDNRQLLDKINSIMTTAANPQDFDRCGIIGNNSQLENIISTLKKIAPTDAPVLITGENGTGKEMIARAIHENSRRHGKPFVKVNLGGISRSLFESEMFGHKKGSFTGAVADRTGRFEMADGGTIFLDEIGELDVECQVKLLRVLQEKTFEPLGDSRSRNVDVRIICATNAPLEDMIKAGSFREDLYYRINLITIHLPALRERIDDIPILIRHFADTAGHSNVIFSQSAIDRLSNYPFPGNIRQLKNIVERTLLMCDGNFVTDSDIALPETEHTATLDEAEKFRIEEIIKSTGGNVSRAAAILGLTRQALYRRMDKYGIKS